MDTADDIKAKNKAAKDALLASNRERAKKATGGSNTVVVDLAAAIIQAAKAGSGSEARNLTATAHSDSSSARPRSSRTWEA